MSYVNLEPKSSNSINIDSVIIPSSNDFRCNNKDDLKYIFLTQKKKFKNCKYKYYLFNNNLIFNLENLESSLHLLYKISRLDFSSLEDLIKFCSIIRCVKKNKVKLLAKEQNRDLLSMEKYWEAVTRKFIKDNNLDVNSSYNIKLFYHFIKNQNTPEIGDINKLQGQIDLINGAINEDSLSLNDILYR